MLSQESEILVTTASIGTRKERAAFEEAVSDVMRQTQKSAKWRTDFMPSQADPCLQVADYLCLGHSKEMGTRGRTLIRVHKGQDFV